MAEAQECAVCVSPIRRHIDMMFLLGYKADAIVETLPEAPRYPMQVQAHLIAGHVDTDKAALRVTLIGYIQDAKELDDKLAHYLEFGNEGDDKKGLERFGYVSDNKLFSYRMKAMDLKLRAVEMIAKLEGHMRAETAHPLDNPNSVTHNTLMIVQAGDPEIAERMARVMLEQKGYQIRKTEPKAIEIKPNAGPAGNK
jgi:hypothetical protein